jgi:hypothetical protein
MMTQYIEERNSNSLCSDNFLVRSPVVLRKREGYHESYCVVMVNNDLL